MIAFNARMINTERHVLYTSELLNYCLRDNYVGHPKQKDVTPNLHHIAVDSGGGGTGDRSHEWKGHRYSCPPTILLVMCI